MEQSNIKSGQSLVEIIVAVGIASILIVGSATGISFFLKSGNNTRNIQAATLLSSEYIDGLNSLVESNWNNLYYPPAAKGSGSQFYLIASGTTYFILAGSTSTLIGGYTYTRYFSIENVNRDSCGVGYVTSAATTTCSLGPGTTGVTNDPSIQKITVYVNWPSSSGFSKVIYLTRNLNFSFSQIDWSGGASQEYFTTSSAGTIVNNQFATSSASSTNSRAINFSTPGAIKIKF